MLLRENTVYILYVQYGEKNSPQLYLDIQPCTIDQYPIAAALLQCTSTWLMFMCEVPAVIIGRATMIHGYLHWVQMTVTN